MKHTKLSRRQVLGISLAAALPVSNSHAASNTSDTQFDRRVDAVVVGAGMAGLTAACELARKGVKTLLIEKRSWFGGDGILSTGTIFAAQTEFHERDNVREGISVEDYWKRLNAGLDDEPLSKVRDNLPESIIYSGIAKHDPSVLRACVEVSPEVTGFIASFGIEFLKINPEKPFLISTAPGSMSKLADGLMKRILSSHGEILAQTSVEHLITSDNGAVQGVFCRDREGKTLSIGAQAVILATGGFLDNQDLMRHYKRYWAVAPKGFHSVEDDLPKDHTGDGIVMARRIGAALEDMESVPKFYTATRQGIPNFSWMIFDTESAYAVNRNGRRFVNEHEARYSGCALTMLREKIDGGYVLFDDKTMNGVNARRWHFAEMLESGGLFKADSVEQLARLAGVSPEGLAATVDRINKDAALGVDSEFGRQDPLFRPLEAPFYLSAPYWPVMFKTEGGIEVNRNFQVLRHSDLSPIPGLYAIGATCGSISTRLCDVFASGLLVARNRISGI